MEKDRKTVLAMVITVVILIAVFSGFWLTLFWKETPQVVLPTVNAPQDQNPTGTEGPDLSGDLVIDVTPKTVQSIIGNTLTRPASYSREVGLETFWGESGAALSSAQVWVDGGFAHIASLLPDGTVEHTIVGEGKRYRWYNSGPDYYCVDAREADADLMQRIPTYEDILLLDIEDITATGYEEKGGLDCIYVEALQKELGYRERYWVSVELGLLVAAETLKEEQVVLRVSTYAVEIPIREGLGFTLPDGTVLHTPIVYEEPPTIY